MITSLHMTNIKVKGQWLCHWGIVVNDFLSLALLCPGFAWSFSFPSISEDRPGRSADKPTGLQTCSPCSRAETISSGSAPPGEEPEPLQPLGHTSDKQGWAEEEAGLIWGIRRHEEESGFSSDLQLMFEKIKIKKKLYLHSSKDIFAKRKWNCGPPSEV